PDQLAQPLERLFAVPLLAAVSLRLDDHDPVPGDAAVAARQEPLLVEPRQGRGADVEAQMDGARDLVDVLPAGALGADRPKLDLFLRNLHRARDPQHQPGGATIAASQGWRRVIAP